MHENQLNVKAVVNIKKLYILWPRSVHGTSDRRIRKGFGPVIYDQNHLLKFLLIPTDAMRHM